MAGFRKYRCKNCDSSDFAVEEIDWHNTQILEVFCRNCNEAVGRVEPWPEI